MQKKIKEINLSNIQVARQELQELQSNIDEIEKTNKLEVGRTKNLVNGVLELDKVQGQLSKEDIGKIQASLDKYIDPWVNDISRGGEVMAKEVNAVTDNVSITD